MELAFYISGLVAVLATLRVITHTQPVHALLYLIISLMAIAGVFFSLGAYLAGAMEIIVYTGAIMVLFVFVVMMLNVSGGHATNKYALLLRPQFLLVPSIFALVLLAILVRALAGTGNHGILGELITAKTVSIELFGPYVLAVELASMLLLAGLVVAFHLGRDVRGNLPFYKVTKMTEGEDQA